ncbi:hypothetical protein LTR53_000625 [Teratosphaeriaceae sp. CCFEE 6253]|nr:hypothetical protein LTR53_000625 [Teratosphaeriaceae sp. CCFEE 6253]
MTKTSKTKKARGKRLRQHSAAEDDEQKFPRDAAALTEMEQPGDSQVEDGASPTVPGSKMAVEEHAEGRQDSVEHGGLTIEEIAEGRRESGEHEVKEARSEDKAASGETEHVVPEEGDPPGKAEDSKGLLPDGGSEPLTGEQRLAACLKAGSRTPSQLDLAMAMDTLTESMARCRVAVDNYEADVAKRLAVVEEMRLSLQRELEAAAKRRKEQDARVAALHAARKEEQEAAQKLVEGFESILDTKVARILEISAAEPSWLEAQGDKIRAAVGGRLAEMKKAGELDQFVTPSRAPEALGVEKISAIVADVLDEVEDEEMTRVLVRAHEQRFGIVEKELESVGDQAKAVKIEAKAIKTELDGLSNIILLYGPALDHMKDFLESPSATFGGTGAAGPAGRSRP